MTLQFLILALYSGAMIAGFIAIKSLPKDKQPTKPGLILLCIMLFAVAVRLFYSLRNVAFWYDVDCFKAWADCTHYYGLKGLYSADIFLDYPPGYMYVLALTKSIQNLFNLETTSVLYTCIIKAPAMIADLCAGLFLYKLAKNHLDEKWALFLTAGYVFAPAVVFNSSVWGQIDSYYSLFVILAIYLASQKKTVPAALLYAVALFTKPQALLFGPVLLFFIIETRSVKECVKALATGLGAIWLMALPFTQGLNPLWLIDHYKNTFGGYKYFTVNAYNFYMALGLNWKSLDKVHGSGSINIIVIGTVMALCAWAFFKIKNKGKFFYIGYILITVIFTFSTMMHERYIFPALLLCLLAGVMMKDRRLFFLFLAIQGVCFLNVSGSMLSQYNGVNITVPVYTFVSLGLVITCLYSIYILVKMAINDNKVDFKKPSTEKVAIIALTLFYAVFAFFQLGNTKAPQTFYQSMDGGEWFTMAFDEPAQVKEIFAYTGLGDEFYPEGSQRRKIGVDFEILYLDENGLWQSLGSLENSYVYTWQKKSVDVFTSKVMVRANQSDQVLSEIIFLNDKGEIIRGQIELSRPDWGSYSPYLAVDESECVPYDTSYYSSMYFDEVYHGRTAYEQLNGQTIFETTHPPLGKTIIEIGIVLFGMTPFGWRFMGALCGVIMVPLMYYLAKLLFKNKPIAFGVAGIFAFDFMHYTQTRIATVDTFVVLFVILTFLFMLKYHLTKLTDPLPSQWLYLLLSGIFMGCAVATKWNGAYSMIGLALFFFASLSIRYKKALSEENTAEIKARLNKIIASTIGFCFLAFIFVPFLIYFASFGTVLRSSGFAGNWAEFWRYQQNMFSYHADLVAEHFFASPWYTWLYMKLPIWYSVEKFADGTVSTISAFGNPAVWWAIPFAIFGVLGITLKKKDSVGLFILLGYFASLLPWVFITRLTFIYHYFPATIFGVLAIGYILNVLYEKYPSKRKLLIIYPAIVLLCFILFLPVISGIPAPLSYVNALELFPTWYFA